MSILWTFYVDKDSKNVDTGCVKTYPHNSELLGLNSFFLVGVLHTKFRISLNNYLISILNNNCEYGKPVLTF